jgi:phage terminase small subunit
VPGSPEKRFRKILLDDEGLNPQERRFVDRYVIHHVARRAMEEAYGLASGHNLQRLITKPEIISAIKRRENEISERFNLTAEWVVQQLTYIAGARHRDLYDKEGNPIPIHELPDYADAALAGVEYEDIWEKDEDGKKVRVGRILKYRHYNKNESAALLMRHLGIDHGSMREGRDRLKELVEVFKAGPVKTEKALPESTENKKEEKK